MTKHTSWAIALTATTFLSAPAIAVSLTPTLDNLKSEAGTVLPSVNDTYNLTELSGDLPEGAVKVEIGDKNYYFTPSGDDAGLLTTLAGTSAGMLKESSDGLFELDGKKYGFDVASIPDSAFSYSEGSEDDYNFTMSEADADGSLTAKYYKTDLKPEAFATSQNISWTAVGEDQKDAADVVAVQLPNNRTEYFKYTYIPTPHRKVYNTSQENLSGDVDADFSGIIGTILNNTGTIGNITGDFVKNDGGFHNAKNGVIGNITGDFVKNRYINNYGIIGNITGNFISNKASGFYGNGGAIYNNGTIGDITGHFIRNSGNYTGGAIYNDNGTIGDITGDFIGNYIDTDAGAIANYYGTIGNIAGDFVGNTSNRNAGAIQNSNIMGNITGDFIGNSAHNEGGAIYNVAVMGNITGNFIKNITSGNGGAITSYNQSIGDITGNFIRNSAKTQWRRY